MNEVTETFLNKGNSNFILCAVFFAIFTVNAYFIIRKLIKGELFTDKLKAVIKIATAIVCLVFSVNMITSGINLVKAGNEIKNGELITVSGTVEKFTKSKNSTTFWVNGESYTLFVNEDVIKTIYVNSGDEVTFVCTAETKYVLEIEYTDNE